MTNNEYFWGRFIKDDLWVSEKIRRTLKIEKFSKRKRKINRLNKKYLFFFSDSIVFKKEILIVHGGHGTHIGTTKFHGKTIIFQNSTIGASFKNTIMGKQQYSKGMSWLAQDHSPFQMTLSLSEKMWL